MADKLFKGGDLEGAMRLVNSAMEIDPQNPYAVAYRERILLAIEQTERKGKERPHGPNNSGATYSNFIDASGPLTSTALDNAIDHVNYWSGGVRAIIGTEGALAPLSTFGQYKLVTGSSSDSYVTINGQTLGTFQNVSPYGNGPKAVESYRRVNNIVRVKQIFDNTVFPPRPLLPSDYILVVGDNIGEFITYGGPQFKEYVDNRPTPPYWNFETWIQFGMMIWNARGLVKVAVTSTVP